MTPRPLILEVLWGPGQGRKAVVGVDQRLSVGSDPAAGWCLDFDTTLPALCFEIYWDGQVADVRGPADTSLHIDGHAKHEGRSGHGGWLRIGATDLALTIQHLTPPDEAPTPALCEAAAPVITALTQLPSPRFALLDTIRSRRIHVLLRESPAPWRSLYDGPQGDALAEAAPALVELERDPQLVQALVQEGWDARWGLYLSAPAGRDLDAVRQHLRKFLRVKVGLETVYFRFYDPRVFATFMPTCTAEERRELLGDLTWYILDERTRGLVTYRA